MPMTRAEANDLIRRWHSHHGPVRMHRFALGAIVGGDVVGCVVVGNAKAHALQAQGAWEVVRLCTNGHRNAASFLLGAAWRSARAMGVVRMVSYTRKDELGTCYRAAGWQIVAETKADDWTTRPGGGRHRQYRLPGIISAATEPVDRWRWEIGERMGVME